MRTTTFKFYDTSSLLVMGSELFNNRFAISSITLEELELIKVSANKDSDIKYAARQLLNQLYHNIDKYDVINYQPEMLEPLHKVGLYLDNNDMRILACATYYDIKYHEQSEKPPSYWHDRSWLLLAFGALPRLLLNP